MPKKQPSLYAANLRRLRTSAGLTQRAAAKKLKISNVYLCELEAGRAVPSLPLLMRAATLFAIEPAELLR